MKRDLTIGTLLMALAALGYGTNPIFGKFAYRAGATPISLMAIRFTLAALGMWAFLLWRGKGGGLAFSHRLRLVLLGATGFAGVALTYFVAIAHLGSGLAAGLFYTYPAMVAAVTLIRGGRLSRAGYAGLLLTGIGTWLLVGVDLGGFSWYGAAIDLLSAVIYTAYVLVGEQWAYGVATDLFAAHVIAGSAAVFLVLSFATGQPNPGIGAYVAGVGLAVCSTIVALIAFFAGMARVGSARASILSTLEPVFTSVMALLLLGERLTLLQALGILVIVSGAALAQAREQSAPATARKSPVDL